MKIIKKILIPLLIVAAIIMSVGCSKSTSVDEERAYDLYECTSSYYYPEEKAAGSINYSTSNLVQPVESSRKLILSSSITVETKQYDEFMEKLYNEISAQNGYVETSDENGNSYLNSENRYSYVTARIPTESLQTFVDKVNTLGNVTHKSSKVNDITSSYVDTESRINVLKDEEASLRALMASPDATVEDLMNIQQRLYDVIEEKEAYIATLNSYDNKIEYSTVTINVDEVKELTPAKEESKGEELVRRIKESLVSLKDAIVEFGILAIVILPWLIIPGIIAVVIIIIVKKKRKAVVKEKNE